MQPTAGVRRSEAIRGNQRKYATPHALLSFLPLRSCPNDSRLEKDPPVTSASGRSDTEFVDSSRRRDYVCRAPWTGANNSVPMFSWQ